MWRLIINELLPVWMFPDLGFTHISPPHVIQFEWDGQSSLIVSSSSYFLFEHTNYETKVYRKYTSVRFTLTSTNTGGNSEQNYLDF